MTPLRRALMAGSVFCVALATGHVMQHGSAIADRIGWGDAANAQPVADPAPLERIEDTLAEPALPQDPRRRDSVALPMPRDTQTEASNLVDRLSDQNARSPFGLECEITATAAPAPGAMARLGLTAPCYGGAAVTVLHEGLRATLVTSPEGRLTVDLPALSPQASYLLRFGDGVSVTAEAQVREAADYDRIALSWQGEQPLGLHAYEFGAAPGSAGHVHVGQAYVPQRGANLGRGFLTRLGEGDAMGWRAEIFSFPRAAARQTGSVTLAVSAEVTEAHCGQALRAQTHVHRAGMAEAPPMPFVLTLPDCSAVGAVMELKNLVQPLKVAGN